MLQRASAGRMTPAAIIAGHALVNALRRKSHDKWRDAECGRRSRKETRRACQPGAWIKPVAKCVSMGHANTTGRACNSNRHEIARNDFSKMIDEVVHQHLLGVALRLPFPLPRAYGPIPSCWYPPRLPPAVAKAALAQATALELRVTIGVPLAFQGIGRVLEAVTAPG